MKSFSIKGASNAKVVGKISMKSFSIGNSKRKTLKNDIKKDGNN